MAELITHLTEGTCSSKIEVTIDNNIIESVEFSGGCPGNLLGITKLITGMYVDDVLEKVEGLKCGSRETSCPDQLAKALRTWKDNR